MPDTKALAIQLQPHVAQLNTALAQPELDPTTIISLIAELLPGAISLYQSISAQYSGPAKTVEEILGTADANWDAIAAAAKGQ